MRAPRFIVFTVLLALLGARCDDAESLTRCAPSRVANGRVVLNHCPVAEQTVAHECGPRCRQLTRVGNAPDSTARYCVTRRAVYWVAGGYLLRADLATGRAVSLLGPWNSTPPVSATGVACEGDAVVFTGSQRPPQRLDLVARFQEGDAVATVAWSDAVPRRDTPAPEAPAIWGTWLAWSWAFTVPGIWALEPGGTVPRGVRMDVRPAGPIVATPDALIFQAGIRVEILRRGATVAEALAPGPGDQWEPAVGGGRAAWVDQRDDLAGSFRAPRNPQIYLLDLASRDLHRVTLGAPPAYRASPFLSDHWLVWVDTRHDPEPDRGRDATYMRAEVYGYDLRARREVALATDVIAYAPRIAGRNLYYVSHSDGTRTDVFVQDLP